MGQGYLGAKKAVFGTFQGVHSGSFFRILQGIELKKITAGDCVVF